ncbi:MAG: TonB-dependent receptor [Prolixibacteraceae bacterium]|nr:TonB-dependent receptor [Prolixibacteraceae bacterium]
MKNILVLVLILILAMPVFSQKKRERVKRKYRKVEVVNNDLPQVYLWGKVKNQQGDLLQGVSVVLIGSKQGVHSNTEGEYLLSGLSTGRQRIQASLNGYKTKYTDIVLQDGINELYFTLDLEPVYLEPEITTIQKREQTIIDVPSSMKIFTGKFINLTDVAQVSELNGFLPGADFRLQNSTHPVFSIRGIHSESTVINENQGIGVIYNDIQLDPFLSSSFRLFDMERVEVFRGPQQVTSGINAFSGAIQYLSKKPTEKNEGYLSARYGDFGQKEVEGAINIPIIGEYLFSRVAGFYQHTDGYISNSSGRNLNGINKYGGRLSLLVKPSVFTRVEMEVNYQKDDEPGIAYLNPDFFQSNIYTRYASLHSGDSLTTQRELFNAILNARYYISEHTYISSVSSYQINSAYELWDGDGTASEAFNFSNLIDKKRFTQELRLNITRNSRLNGFGAISYLHETGTQSNDLTTNEQHLYYFLNDYENMINSEGQPNFEIAFPFNSTSVIPEGTILPAYHQEEKYMKATNQWIEAFGDATLNVSYRIRLTGGIRIAFNRMKLYNANLFSGGYESILGQDIGNSPNYFYTPTDTTTEKLTTLALMYRGGFNYKFNPDASLYGNYSLGLKPRYLNFKNDGTSEKIPAQKIQNFELGFKGIYRSRLWLDITGFYSLYSGFLSTGMALDTTGSITNTETAYKGKATIYGAEANIRYAIIKGLDFFGNYAWTKTQFDETDKDGNTQEYSGNQIKMTPEHIFGAGLYFSTTVGNGLDFFVMPDYSYQTGFYFDDANSDENFQKSYGVLNVQTGLNFENPDITFMVYAKNILEENYLIYNGTTNEFIGPSLVLPSSPRMVGARLTWNFSMEKRPYYKRRR